MSEIVTRPTPSMVLRPQTFDQLFKFATMAAASDLVPKDYKNKPENVMLAVQMGSELGLAPMQALQNIAVINGRPAVWGDALLGLCKAAPECQDVIETMTGEGKAMTARCVAMRYGKEPVEATFSVADAEKAGLWGKAGPWTQYPARMLQMRARGFALRDAFPDILKGLQSAEEVRDISEDRQAPKPAYKGPTIEAEAQAADAPYCIAKKSGTVCYETVSLWTDAWRAAVKNHVVAGALDKLATLRDMNAELFAAFPDQDAVAAVRDTLANTLGEPPPREPGSDG